jgi:hypothetical protein
MISHGISFLSRKIMSVVSTVALAVGKLYPVAVRLGAFPSVAVLGIVRVCLRTAVILHSGTTLKKFF